MIKVKDGKKTRLKIAMMGHYFRFQLSFNEVNTIMKLSENSYEDFLKVTIKMDLSNNCTQHHSSAICLHLAG